MEPLSTNPSTDLTSSGLQDHSVDCYTTLSVSVDHDMSTSDHVDNPSEPMVNDVKLQQCAMPGKETGQPQVIHHNSAQMDLSTPNKRKATTELLPDNWGAQKMSAPNKRATQAGSFAKVSSPTGVSTSNSLRSGASGKRGVQGEHSKNRYQSTVPKRNVQSQTSPKPIPETYDSVRVKLRESLAAALATASPQLEPLNMDTKTENDVARIDQKGVENKSVVVKNESSTSVKSEEASTSSFSCPTDGCIDIKNASGGSHSKEIDEEATQTWNYLDAELQSNPVLGEDVSFGNNYFLKDELLQGNGLSWAPDFNPHIPDAKEAENSENLELMQEKVVSPEKEQIIQSPESVALQIESELFKLFGGVNKKYKEKGRSLLFNLKDRSNPHLRERVMAGAIPPDRLCSMTAEELASEELSQWRIAKAEELDLMKVLPDSEANMRRLVKKTHKGEYQVDLDPNEDAAEEIPVGSSLPAQNPSKTNDTETGALSKSDKTKEGQITFLSDGTDMQGLMVDDMSDLPPILSFDEFMDSLDKEPPFADLQGLAPASHGSNNEKLKVGLNESLACEQPPKQPLGGKSDKTESISSPKPSKQPVEITLERNKSMSPVHTSINSAEPKLEITNGASVECVDPGHGVRLADTQKRLNNSAVIHQQKGERVWEGLLQLNISSVAGFVAFFKSGEKTSTREWPGFFDIKGRVKLDAFDNFVQALPTSRSRSIMVTHFVLKEGSTEIEQASLQELIDSYNMDQRLGFAEPAPGLELYLCPPHSKSVEVIFTHLNKNITDKLKDIDNGLIGLLVWRKIQITPPSISHNSSHHHLKDTPRKTGAQNLENDTRRNTLNFGSRNAPPAPVPLYSQPNNQEDDDDDDEPPPGFGPPAPRKDDDDLPEFNFTGSSNQPLSHTQVHYQNPTVQPRVHHNPPSGASSHKVEKMRELILKYGQNGNKSSGGIPIQPWNDDDDDDMPEWQPQSQPQPQIQPPRPPAQPPIVPHNPVLTPPPIVNHPTLQRPPQQAVWPPVGQPLQPLQRPMNVVHQQGGWWPYGYNNVGNQHMVGRGWRPNNNGI